VKGEYKQIQACPLDFFYWKYTVCLCYCLYTCYI